MAKLYRPHVPIKVKCLVAARQLGWADREMLVRLHQRDLATLLSKLTNELAERFGCQVRDLRLDHDPPLGARMIKSCVAVRGKMVTVYDPDANDLDHLRYRPHGPEHEGSHLIKTNVRGDHGQHPDRVLIKKQRRLERGPKPKRGPKIRSRGFTKSTDKLTRKMKSRPFQKRRKR